MHVYTLLLGKGIRAVWISGARRFFVDINMYTVGPHSNIKGKDTSSKPRLDFLRHNCHCQFNLYNSFLIAALS